MQIRDRIVEMRRVLASTLVPNPKNWREHPKAQQTALRGMLEEVGNAGVLLTRELPDGRLMLIDGHLRSDILADEEVPVVILDLTEEEADKLLATFDPLSAMAGADKERLTLLLNSFASANDGVAALLEDIRNRQRLVESVGHVADPATAARSVELQKKWETATGQVWQAGEHRVICGDCSDRTVVEDLWQGSEHRFRMIWTDPPYGVNYAKKNEYLNKSDRGNHIQTEIVGDAGDAPAIFAAALKASFPHADVGAAIYVAVPSGLLREAFIHGLEAGGYTFRQDLIWVKNHFVIGQSDYQPRHESILYGWREGAHFFTSNRSQDTIFEIDKPHSSDLHPTTKPIELIARMIANSSKPGDLVYDPFCGSGSTIMAAHQLNRIGYAIEIAPAYVAVILERLAELGLTPELRRSPDFD